MFKIIKKGSNNFWHIYNNGAKNVSISDFEVVLDDVLNTFVIVLRNGANIPQIALSVLDIIVIDETASSVEETFLTASQLRARLVVLGYTAYLGAGNADSITGLISGGTNVTITGTGTLADPYVISSSGGSGTTPTLQEVTDEGNVTTNPIILESFGSTSEIGANDSAGEFYIKTSENGGKKAVLNTTDITADRRYDFQDSDGVIALLSNIPTTATDLDALKRDGSNANSDVDIDAYSLKAKSVLVGGANKMELRGDGLGTNRTAQWQNKDYDAIADLQDIIDYLATFKTTEYLDATSSIQGQLDSKQPILSYTPYKFVQTSQALHTGTTSETIVATETISGGVFNANDSMKALFKCTKVTSTSNVIMRLRINTTNSLSGSVQIATLTLTTANVYGKMNRTFDLNGGNLYGYNFSSSLATDNTATNTTSGSTAYNTANTLYFFWTVQLGTAIDSVTPNLANLTN